jgi:GDPmannose 4,6-dehydratase
LGDYSKAKKTLGWKPRVKFKELARIMVEADFDNEKRFAGI